MVQIDMEMPTSCSECEFHRLESGFPCILSNTNDCPLKEVPSGKWITYKDEHQCSCCKEIIIVSEERWEDNEYEYCPNCGAKMEN